MTIKIIVEAGDQWGHFMGLVTEISERVGNLPFVVDARISDPIFLDDPFDVNVNIKSRKDMILESVKIGLFMETNEVRLLDFLSIVHGHSVSGSKTVKHLLKEEEFRNRNELMKGFETDLQTSFMVAEDMTNYAHIFFIRVEIGYDNIVNFKKDIKLKLLKDKYESAPYLTMKNVLNFSEIDRYLTHGFINEPDNCYLKPPPDRYPKLSHINLKVRKISDGRLEIIMDMDMCEHPERLIKGKHESLLRCFEVHLERIVVDDRIDYEFMKEIIDLEIRNGIASYQH